MMKVLVISRAPWRNDNNTGNTLTNLFSDLADVELYSLCMREQPPQNNLAERHFFISEMQMIRRLMGKKTVIGQENSPESVDQGSEKAIYDAVKKHPSTIMLAARELLWSIGGWRNGNLKRYIEEVEPDVIFFPVFGCYYPHKLLQYIHSLCDARIVLFHTDDHYTLKQFSLSPLYWWYRFGLRKWVRRSARLSDIQYCISEVQKVDYDRMLDGECKVLTKFADFSDEPSLKTAWGDPLQLVFTGNININRWKSLSMLAKVLERINRDGVKAQLRVYTMTPLTGDMRKALDKENTSFLMGSVPSTEVSRIQSEADILVLAEPTDLKNRLIVRQSFSTKIVDYLKAARPIVAIGPKEVASIKHFVDHDCAIVADNEQELYEKLTSVLDDAQQLQAYAMQAYMCGRNNHDKKQQNAMLQQDLLRLTAT